MSGLFLPKGLLLSHLCFYSAFQSLSLQWPVGTLEASTGAEETPRLNECLSGVKLITPNPRIEVLFYVENFPFSLF